ncbi:longitudinals lacking protein, isoforms A/B/D/L-like isoform X2 [Bombus flavifrons]|uniref:longitudinals lacking protein, isoforms A/B/D/L-like isoform X2 n=1 Tax=Bombus flavifrons TaxID=103934 RepID=UPI003704C93B
MVALLSLLRSDCKQQQQHQHQQQQPQQQQTSKRGRPSTSTTATTTRGGVVLASRRASNTWDSNSYDSGNDNGGACWYRLPIGFETYPCDTCGRQYRRVISLQRHKRLECGKEAQFECVICHAKFKHKHSLLRHYNVHVVDVKKSSNFEREERSA